MSHHKQLPLPLPGISFELKTSVGISRYASPTAKELNWITQTGECNHCGSPLRIHEEAFIVFSQVTGEITGLRCSYHEPSSHSFGPWHKIISVEGNQT